MKKTQFRFFKDTPLIDFQNTIHFTSREERDTFFLEGGHYSELRVQHHNFNFIRDRSTVDLPVAYDDMRGVNYCTFLSEFENVRYYAYVISYEYINDENVRVYLLIDPIMTFTQGETLRTLPNLTIQRQHLSIRNYEKNLWELKNNDDILKTHTKNYFHTDRLIFDDLLVLIQSSVDLRSNFGDVDDPKIKTSSGMMFDQVTSPLNLYACDIEDFNKLMRDLSDYPWISQNINSMQLIPRLFMEDNLTKTSFTSNMTLSGADYLYEVTGLFTWTLPLQNKLNDMSYTMNEAYALFGLDPIQDRHLLRNEYTTTELYNYSGGQLFIDNGQLNKNTGLMYWADVITGHHNEIKIYVDNYRNEGHPKIGGGAYVNDSLVFSEFDDVPMLIDNFTLSMAKSANRRELAESKLVTNRIQTALDPQANLKDRFFDAASLISNFSPSNLFGKFNDEYEFYRSQQAEQADLALETPSITAQTTGNSFNIANDMFGVHFKYSKPSDSEVEKIKKYYKMFGYQMNDVSNQLDSLMSMSICNYVQFTGSWTLQGVDVALIEMMKAQFENGVRFWHNNGTANPMRQNVLENVMVR